MKIKRLAFISSLIVLFVACFYIMNQHYDELARYPYVTNENREIILKYLNTDDIDYMINQQLKPEQFLPFIETDGFEIRNTLWYTKAKEVRDDKNEVIVSFVNDFRKQIDYSSLETLLKAYDYTTLRTFYEVENPYIKNATIKTNPQDFYTMLEQNETLYRYVPQNMVTIQDLPYASLGNEHTLKVKEEVVQPLHDLCESAQSVNNKTCGNLILTAGYISYEEQIPLYEQMLLKYGQDSFQMYWDYPGQNEYQLGYTIRFQYAGKKESNVDETMLADIEKEKNAKQEVSDEQKKVIEEENEMILWMQENAYKYGFTVRYPKGKEKVTGKKYQPFTLRYVGKEVAKELYDEHKTLEEYYVSIK